ncbi:DeoR/GlpR transcriptional regulator [Egibacter rhizosphaerae]|uniref:DeoR/GlpR transcriptional regulator n=1 Tax=Egibacter rhizosphaerae TaxID=1670831 RepID=A0A411YK34_9ACTN|nr:DeoR/GlpR family DNA-binding transcription regulator [Egibacter rhizosphaerae]QBI21562.1 DeoR/GlpR transcriptional regulator [Egibacter rhizosphaerae]
MGDEEPVSAAARRELIREFVNQRSFTHVTELVEHFGVSAVTVRADLELLAQRGQLRRVRGGALPRAASGPEQPFERTADVAAGEKAAIARVAADLVEDGQTVLCDVGTTTTAFARALAERDDLRDVTVVTNGLSVARELEAAIPRIAVVVTGGTLRSLQHSLVNPWALKLLGELTADAVFLGCNGVDPEAGITNANLPESEVKEAMLTRARLRVVLADASKLGRVSVARLCGVRDVDLLLTDAGAEPDVVTALEDTGLEVRRAEVAEERAVAPLVPAG